MIWSKIGTKAVSRNALNRELSVTVGKRPSRALIRSEGEPVAGDCGPARAENARRRSRTSDALRRREFLRR